jgi:hypothetical protein
MKVMLSPGETLQVGYLDDDGRETDGGLSVVYGENSIKVETDWPDTQGRTGVVYEEKFGVHLDPDEVDCLAEDSRSLKPVQLEPSEQRKQMFKTALAVDLPAPQQGSNQWAFASDAEIRFDEQRRIAADAIAESFNFDPDGTDKIEDISHSDGWNYVDGADHWNKAMFVRYENTETSTKYRLTVQFKPGTAEIIEAVAQEEDGDDTIVETYQI